MVRKKGIIFILLFVFLPFEEIPPVILGNENSNIPPRRVLESKECSNLSMNDDSLDLSLKIDEEVRYERSKNLRFQTYQVPAFGEKYKGELRARDVTINCIINGGAEGTRFERWTTLEYQGDGDSAEPEILGANNAWGYVPRDDDYCYLFNVDSSQLGWIVDYYADTSIPCDDTRLSFSFSNAWESSFADQTNVNLFIIFDFDGFDATFFLFAKIPTPYNYNTTVGGQHYLHFLLNESWSSDWHNVGPIDLATALLEQNMYTESSLPSYFSLNEIIVGAMASPSYQLHLLLDNLSFKTDLAPSKTQFTVNEQEFDQDTASVEGDVNDEYVEFTIESTRYDSAKYKLTGDLDFSLGFFQENLSFTVKYAYLDETNVEWIVNFNVPSTGDDDLELYKIFIYAPPEWDAISLTDSKGKEWINHAKTKIERDTSELYVRLKYPERTGDYLFKARGPNYITALDTPDLTNHTYGVSLNITLRKPFEENIVIQLIKLPDVETLLTKTMPVNSDFLATVIELNKTMTRGNYRVIATIGTHSQLRAGIRIHDFILTTDWAMVEILSKNTTSILCEYTLAVLCYSYVNESRILNASVTYSWAMGNGSVIYDPAHQIYTTMFRADAPPGNYTIIVQVVATGYVFPSTNMTIQILESEFSLNLITPENITEGDSFNIVVQLNDFKGQPVEGVSIYVFLNDVKIAEEVTPKNGTIIISSTQNLQANTIANVTVIAYWKGYDLASSSKTITILESPSSNITTSEVISPPLTTSKEVADFSSINSSWVYGVIGTLTLFAGTIIFYKRRKSISIQESGQAGEIEIENVSEGINEIDGLNHPPIEIPSETPTATFADLSSLSRQLRGVQTVNDFARELGISPEKVIELIDERNKRVPNELRWRIVGGGQFIIPHAPNTRSD